MTQPFQAVQTYTISWHHSVLITRSIDFVSWQMECCTILVEGGLLVNIGFIPGVRAPYFLTNNPSMCSKWLPLLFVAWQS